jgi:hypothetical protein
MKSVQDVYDEVRALQWEQALSPYQVVERLEAIFFDNHQSGLVRMTKRVAPPTISLIFHHTGEVVRFDGKDWHYEPGSRKPRLAASTAGLENPS